MISLRFMVLHSGLVTEHKHFEIKTGHFLVTVMVMVKYFLIVKSQTSVFGFLGIVWLYQSAESALLINVCLLYLIHKFGRLKVFYWVYYLFWIHIFARIFLQDTFSLLTKNSNFIINFWIDFCISESRVKLFALWRTSSVYIESSQSMRFIDSLFSML
jgi:hypothetical protein